LQYRGHSAGLAGPILMVFSGVSALGAFLYGTRKWPGGVRGQSLVALAATAVGVVVYGLVGPLAGLIGGLLFAALFQSVVMVTRNLSLRERLPEVAHAAGYSTMYAVQGVGYTAAAIGAAVMLDHVSPVAAVLIGVALTVLLAGVSALAELRHQPAGATPAVSGERVGQAS
jgi:hypothetical protein